MPLLSNILNAFSYQCQHFKVYFHFIKAGSFYLGNVTKATIKMHSYILGKCTISLPPKEKLDTQLLNILTFEM